MSVFIIAEAGVNHNGDIGLAHRLVDAAADCGANAVSFHLARGHHEIRAHAEQRGIEFMSTPFDVDSLWFLVRKVKVKRLKIASGNLDNVPLLTAAVESGLPLVISTGTESPTEIHTAMRSIRDYAQTSDVTFLHSPSERNETNLWIICELIAQGYRAGFASGTDGIDDILAAVSIGAQMVEKRLTLDRHMSGPNHNTSVEPTEFHEMWRRIQSICAALGNDANHIEPAHRT